MRKPKAFSAFVAAKSGTEAAKGTVRTFFKYQRSQVLKRFGYSNLTSLIHTIEIKTKLSHQFLGYLQPVEGKSHKRSSS